MTASEAERLVLLNGFLLIRSKGSHRIYAKGSMRLVIPFHSGIDLHPKIVKQILSAIEK
jgi:predicted RNA binding protein YcfA (HicA-like mRNA interferase family)